MELLRNLRTSTRLLFLYEVTTSRHTRLRTIGERLGMTIQGTSEYAHGLEEDGFLSLVNGAAKGDLVAVRDLEGIVALRPGRIVLVRIRSTASGKRAGRGQSRRLPPSTKEFVIAALDVAGLVAAKELGVRPRIEFGVLAAVVEAAERGVSVLLLLPEDRVAEAVRTIEAANARLEDKIPYESTTLG